VVHTVSPPGPASVSALDRQRISVVALPKNTALTMLLSGSVGYAPAAIAANEGSTVVLSAGYDVDIPTDIPATRLGNIDIRDGTYSNDLAAWATSSISLAPDFGAADFGGDVSLKAAEAIDVSAEVRERVTVAGDSCSTRESGYRRHRRRARLHAHRRGRRTDRRDRRLRHRRFERRHPQGRPAGRRPGRGGEHPPTAHDHQPEPVHQASGIGQYNGALGGSGIGGSIDAGVVNGGTISATIASLYAFGAGGASDAQAGDGTGGALTLSALGGSLDFGTVALGVAGSGGSGGIQAGDGFGGTRGHHDRLRGAGLGRAAGQRRCKRRRPAIPG
jgi:hypothetical protein